MDRAGGGAVTAPTKTPEAPTERAGAAFWIALVIGAGIMAFGIRGALDQLKSFPDVATWVIGADLIHDFVVAPIAIVVGWAVGRVVPMRWRAPIQAGLMATGITVAIGWPGLRGYGRHLVPDNPSVQPLNYATAVGTVVGIIWTVVAIWLIARTLGSRRVSGSLGQRP